MLTAFRVRNYRSIREEQELSLFRSHRLASREAPGPVVGWDVSISPIAALYGPNASGKSNVLAAISFGRRAVVESHSRWQPGGGVRGYRPFQLDGEHREAPTWLEFEFISEGARLQYGFECTRSAFVREWLYAYPLGRRQTWLERNAEERGVWYFGRALAGPNRTIAETTRPDSLFLSAAASAGHPQLANVYGWFAANLPLATEDNARSRLRYSVPRFAQSIRAGRFPIDLIRHADLGIGDVKVRNRSLTDKERNTIQRITEGLSQALAGEPGIEIQVEDQSVEQALAGRTVTLEFEHACADGSYVTLPFEDESMGTRALVALSGPVADALSKGQTLVVDEIDTSLHPQLVAEIVRLFQSPETNPRQAQLIFTTHDTALLGNLLAESPPLERDQIWFVQKDADGSTTLYPLTDFKPRRLENLERGYLQGRYGATPSLQALATHVAMARRKDQEHEE